MAFADALKISRQPYNNKTNTTIKGLHVVCKDFKDRRLAVENEARSRN